jgi:uncharacterized metal-binding protein
MFKCYLRIKTGLIGAAMISVRKYIVIEEKGVTKQVQKWLIDEQIKMILDRFIRKELHF